MREFTVYGNPVAKARARKGAGGNWYTPENTVNYEELVKWSYIKKHKGKELLKGPVRMDLKIFMPIPKSTSKKRKEELLKNKSAHIKKPDSDNIIKSISDSLNGIAYKDDNQVFKGSWEKRYSDNPRVEVMLRGDEK